MTTQPTLTEELLAIQADKAAQHFTVSRGGDVVYTGVTESMLTALRDACPELTWQPDSVMTHRYDMTFSMPADGEGLVAAYGIDAAYDIVDEYFTGYTLSTHIGSWESVLEDSYTVTILTSECDTLIGLIARKLKRAYKQDAVLVVKTPVTAWLV